VHVFDLSLILCFSFVDGLNDAITVSVFERDACEVFVQAEMDVSILKVVIVDLDST